eukprot:TRINITY_DN45961_c0_g1_i1.p1 TRINITY_DN45961_c0_g1~~TRINITY_DN45961_c0_g1_i1.p1  ORF type:complete len:249 (+),score=38.18 TRINITY_DN45961_c0_g1_i1:100-846(+)
MAAGRPSQAEAVPSLRPLGSAARRLLSSTASLPSRPTSAVLEDQDDDAWAREVRASIKNKGRLLISSASATMLPTTCGAGMMEELGSASSSPARSDCLGRLGPTPALKPHALRGGLLPPLNRSASQVEISRSPALRGTSERNMFATPGLLKITTPTRPSELCEEAKAEKEHAAANPRTSALFEDLISFLELNGLPGAYALPLSANGVQDLTQLLTMEPEELERVITKCDLDCMDEILLKDALRKVSAK